MPELLCLSLVLGRSASKKHVFDPYGGTINLCDSLLYRLSVFDNPIRRSWFFHQIVLLGIGIGCNGSPEFAIREIRHVVAVEGKRPGLLDDHPVKRDFKLLFLPAAEVLQL